MRKKLCLCIASLMLAGVWSCQALDYDQHFARGMRVYRVSLGVGGAPSAADMKTIYIRPGDMVANEDDGTLFIMSTTNVYTKIEADGTATIVSMDISDRMDIGAWGYTGEHVGLIDDGSGNTVPGFGQYNEVKTEIAGGKVLAAKYTRLLVSSNQVNDVTCIGHESQFRLRGANLGNGVHAGLWAYAEQSGTSVLSDNGTFDAITATVESEAGFEVGATEQVSGITLDSSINSGATIAGAANFSAVYIKSNGLDWFNGLYITGCDNAILFDGGATIDQSAADTLTLTEDKVNVAGAFTATTIEADNGITSNFTFLSATATTGRMWFSGGILTNVTLTGE